MIKFITFKLKFKITLTQISGENPEVFGLQSNTVYKI